MSSRRLLLVLGALTLLFLSTYATPGFIYNPFLTATTGKTLNNDADYFPHPTFSDAEYQDRLRSISDLFDFRLTTLVKERILQQTINGRSTTEQILGLGNIYFPIFERYLQQYNLPLQLRFLPIIESNLAPRAYSPAGAAGLWQFMPGTGQLYGLRINQYVDERLDAHRSSEAAMKLLIKLYEQYGDWAIVMAAYNCGNVRINNAIKQTGQSDYWAISQYLPRETQRYVPTFIAAAYVATFYYLHDLSPASMSNEYMVTDTLMVNQGTSFAQLAKRTGVSAETIRFLNPHFLKQYIPASKQGYVITLPMESVAAIKGYRSTTDYAGSNLVSATANERPEVAGVRCFHTTSSETSLEAVARLYNCTPEQVAFWNNLSMNKPIPAGTRLAIRKTEEASTTQAQAQVAHQVEVRTAHLPFVPEHTLIRQDGFVYYEVQTGDNLWMVARQYPDVTVKQIIELNGQNRIAQMKSGDYIKIMKY